ncbi:LytTR family transcriptional regulator DNA-binding domain-containing protein [Pedobacter sp. BAL39]|uniref:LytTR family transcriptional regulator DNA-binding domain-containing protein n=1 Tax=Pedobacter sp. BAL39 TaxID=391596 RepID=UPI0018DAF65B|nr:LytTR family transcriptional regulator DNA-binding domain-containing protein [Pedobacter sp. BAL39]
MKFICYALVAACWSTPAAFSQTPNPLPARIKAMVEEKDPTRNVAAMQDAIHELKRCHQSHLVTKAHIISILNEDSCYLMMQHSDKKVPISKQKKGLIKSLLSI